ncbi:MAG: MFS transporter, partial [Planctomycetia bacterium]
PEPTPPDSWALRKFPALGHSAFRLYLSGYSISVVGSWMQQAALAWYVQMLTGQSSEYWLGLTAAVGALPTMVLAPVGGWAADYFHRRSLLIVTQSAAMLVAALFALLVAGDAAALTTAMLFAALVGVCQAFDVPARQVFTVEMVGRKHLLSGVSLNVAVFNVGRLLGPMAFGLTIWLVGGWVGDRLGVAACFLLNAVSFLGVIAALAVMVVDHPRKDDPAARVLGPFGGFQTLFAHGRLAMLVVALAAVLLTGGAYLALLPALSANVMHLGANGYSAMVTASGVGALAGAIVVGSATSLPRRRPIIIGGVLLMGTSLLVLSTARDLWLACPCLVGVGTGFLMFLAGANTTLQLSVDDAVRGRVMSIWVLVFNGAGPAGSYLGGRLASEYGTPFTLRLAAVGCLTASLLAVAAFRFPDPNADRESD